MKRIFKNLQNKFHKIFFDEKYYLKAYPDVQKSGMDAYVHYTIKGRQEGRFPNAYEEKRMSEILREFELEKIKSSFDADYYLKSNEDVRMSGMDAWEHYRRYGHDEGRECCAPAAPNKSTDKNDYTIELYKRGRNTESSKTKFLIICHELSSAPSIINLRNEIEQLTAIGGDVDVWTFGPVRNGRVFDGLGCNIYKVSSLINNPPVAYALLSAYSLIYINTVFCALWSIFCFEHELPHIWMLRDGKSVADYLRKEKLSIRAIRADAKNIYCESEYVQQCCFDSFGIKPAIRYNLVKDEGVLPYPSGEKLIFTIAGPLTKRTGLEYCVAAFVKMSQLLQDKWELNIIGHFDENHRTYWEPLQEITKGYENIHWLGEKTGTDRRDIIAKSDIFVLPSLDEPWSRDVVTAAMLGRACIISENVGARYIVSNGGGAIVSTADDKSLRACLEKIILAGKSEAINMGMAARKQYELTSTAEVYTEKFVCNGMKLSAAPDWYSKINTEKLHDFPDLVYTRKFEKIARPCETTVSAPVFEREVAVIIPVYNGVNFLKKLIPSLYKHTDVPCRFFFVDDCSQAETAEYVKSMVESNENSHYVRNEVNMGFLHTVRRGVNLSGDRDFVILNTDTEVPPRWLSRLIAPLYAGNKVASVTPISSCATIYSFPFLGKEQLNRDFLDKEGLLAIDEAFSKLPYTEICTPTGHGFCMAFSRKAWNEIGPFNTGLYGRGYGDEVDWSQRAIEAGWHHVMAPNLYIAHHHTVSFTAEEREASCRRSNAIINQLYPEFLPNFREFNRVCPHKSYFAYVLLHVASRAIYKPIVIHCDDDLLLTDTISRSDEISTMFIIRHYECGYARLVLKHSGMVFLYDNFDETILKQLAFE